MGVSYINLVAQWEEEKADLLPIIDEVMAKGIFVGGSNVRLFEQAVENFCHVKHCVALNSGTDALMCALWALGVKKGDEVITPPNSFISSTAAIVHLGATPVFIDVASDQNIDVAQIEKSITSKTKVIMPVHLTGRMADMNRIKTIATKFDLKIVEDCAQSIGSKLTNQFSGSFGDIGCFSCHPLKNLNACGDGGFIITDNDDCAQFIREIRNHGMQDRNIVNQFGVVSRMDELQAAILLFRINKLSAVIEKRRQNAEFYINSLDSNHIYFPPETAQQFNSFHTFVIQCKQRDQLKEVLEKKNIQTAIHYPIPIHLQPASKKLGYQFGDFRNAELQAKKILTLPINQYLREAEIKLVSDEINYFFNSQVTF